MICLMLSQVRRSVAGSCARVFQKLLIQSVWRVDMISSYTARTAGLASAYSIMKKLYAARQQLEFEPGQLRKAPIEGHQAQEQFWQTRQDRRLPTAWSQAVRASLRRSRSTGGKPPNRRVGSWVFTMTFGFASRRRRHLSETAKYNAESAAESSHCAVAT